jgi:hypothetical protein
MQMTVRIILISALAISWIPMLMCVLLRRHDVGKGGAR